MRAEMRASTPAWKEDINYLAGRGLIGCVVDDIHTWQLQEYLMG